jgi:hypothetical protein
MFKDPANSSKAQRYVKDEVMNLIRGLKIKGN